MLRALALATILVVVSGGTYLSIQIAKMREAVETQLIDIADLKVSQIESWRRERVGGVSTLAHAPFLADGLAALAARPDDKALLAPIEAYLEEYRRTYGYSSIVLFDQSLAAVVASSEGPDWKEILTPELKRNLALARDVLVVDLHRSTDGILNMDFIAPVHSAKDAFAGAVQLQADARRQLFPIIQQWPMQRKSAEALLLRIDGLSVAYLSDLRFRPDAALNLRYPLGTAGLTSAKAVLERRLQLSEGIDYRGVRVLFVARPVNDSPWVIVAKVDKAEAYASMRTEALKVATIFVLGLFAVGASVSNYWRYRHREYEEHQQEAERERRAAVKRLAVVMRHANDVIMLFDKDLRILEANERALAVYGYSPTGNDAAHGQ